MVTIPESLRLSCNRLEISKVSNLLFNWRLQLYDIFRARSKKYWWFWSKILYKYVLQAVHSTYMQKIWEMNTDLVKYENDIV